MIFRLAVVMSIFLFFLYTNRGQDETGLSTTSVAMFTSFSFLMGCLCSGLSGYVGMWSSVRANVRVASVARRSYHETIQVCLRSGAFCGVIVVALTLIGIATLFMVAYMLFGGTQHCMWLSMILSAVLSQATLLMVASPSLKCPCCLSATASVLRSLLCSRSWEEESLPRQRTSALTWYAAHCGSGF